MKVQEVIEKINNGGYNSLFDVEEDVMGEIKPVASGLNVDKHRWYETSVSVYKMEDGYVGVCAPSDCCGDMDFSDCCCKATAAEYEEVTVVSYQPKIIIIPPLLGDSRERR